MFILYKLLFFLKWPLPFILNNFFIFLFLYQKVFVILLFGFFISWLFLIHLFYLKLLCLKGHLLSSLVLFIKLAELFICSFFKFIIRSFFCLRVVFVKSWTIFGLDKVNFYVIFLSKFVSLMLFLSKYIIQKVIIQRRYLFWF